MNILQRLRCPPIFVADVNFDFIVELELFEEPDDALAAGLVEPVWEVNAIARLEVLQNGSSKDEVAVSR
jgi:hypothetical protein